MIDLSYLGHSFILDDFMYPLNNVFDCNKCGIKIYYDHIDEFYIHIEINYYVNWQKQLLLTCNETIIKGIIE